MSAVAGRVAVITGAGSGIGRATAKLLAREGAIVHVADLAGAEACAAEIVSEGGRATAYAVDVTDAEAVRAMADAVFAADGRADILHNNAGIGHAGPTETVALEMWRRVLEVNVMGVVHGVDAFGARMLTQGGGHIINTASMAGLVPAPGMLPYATSKHAIVGLSESLNAEWGPQGVNVTALCPGFINTPITRNSALTGGAEENRERIVKFYERFGASADDVAKAVLRAIEKRPVIQTVPRMHVLPAWFARRISPRLAQPLTRISQRLMR